MRVLAFITIVVVCQFLAIVIPGLIGQHLRKREEEFRFGCRPRDP